MREIKFRAWNDNKESMYSWLSMLCEDLNNYFDISTNDDGNSVILMQYTGLKDTNSMEIYQGDILKFTNPEGETFYNGLAEVTAKTCGFSFNPIPELTEEDMMFSHYDSSMFWHDKEDYEVIGNIYENPELLEVTL